MNANQASRSDSRLPTVHRRGFTLVEMMVVIVIVAIIIGVAVPSFVRLTSGSAVRGGTRLLAAQLRLTRQFAISQRRNVALLLPGNEITGLPDDLCYVAMKAAIVEPTATAGVFSFVEWVDGAQWLHLPRGAVVAEADDDKGIADSSGFTSKPDEPTPPTCRVTGLAPQDLKDLETTLSSSTLVPIRAIVFSPTGRVKGLSEANITVAQLIYTNGNWISKTPGTNGTSTECTANQFNINVNVFTGRIKIESPPAY